MQAFSMVRSWCNGVFTLGPAQWVPTLSCVFIFHVGLAQTGLAQTDLAQTLPAKKTLPAQSAPAQSVLAQSVLAPAGAGRQVAVVSKTSPSPVQETAFAIQVDNIPDVPAQFMLLGNLEEFDRNITELMQDLKLSAFKDSLLVNAEPNFGIDLSGGVLIEWPGSLGPRFLIQDKEQLIQSMKLNPAPEPNVPFANRVGWMGRSLLLGNRQQSCLISGDWLFCDVIQRLSAEKIRDELTLETIRDFHPSTRALILRSGISFLDNDSEGQFWLSSFQKIDESLGSQMTEHEQKCLAEISQIKPKRSLIAMRYQQQMLELHAIAQLQSETDFHRWLDVETLQQDWQPDLGFMPQDLIASASFQLAAFRTSAASRLLPKFAIGELGRSSQWKWAQTGTIGLLLELMGDSQNDLSAARVAIYQTAGNPTLAADEKPAAGKYAVIGVVDTDKPAVVMEELKRISALTRPSQEAAEVAEREAEIDRLIRVLVDGDSVDGKLNDGDLEQVARAQSRLALTPHAKEALIAAKARAESGVSPFRSKVRTRCNQVLSRIADRFEDSRRQDTAIVDPLFWTTLNPGLEFHPNDQQAIKGDEGRIDHWVEISPDRSKSPAEVESASQLMLDAFGTDWNRMRIVQMPGHFVFMIGSDVARLEAVIANVRARSSLLHDTYQDHPNAAQKGPLQVYANLARLAEFSGQDSPNLRELQDQKKEPNKGAAIDQPDRLLWGGVHVFEDHLEAWSVVPSQQLQYFLPF